MLRIYHQFESYKQLASEKAGKFAISIGNFEGLHLGHRELISRLVKRAKSQNSIAALVTFDPHPAEFFNPKLGSLRISDEQEEMQLLEAWGIEAVLVLKFDQRLANLAADDFMQELASVPLASLTVGDDFAFGKSKTGNFEKLQKYFGDKGIHCEQMPSFLIQNQRVSSSLIRQELAKGNYSNAKMFLGRSYRLAGPVVKGEARGRSIGFPTANVNVDHFFLPKTGVSACIVHVKGREFAAVANLGVRPTFHQDAKPNLEVHLLDFSGDLYGERVEVEFVKYLRPEMKFASLEQLKAQIQKDILGARNALNEKKDS